MLKNKKIFFILISFLLVSPLVACENNTTTQNTSIQSNNITTPEKAKETLEKKYNTPYNSKNFLTAIKSNDLEKVNLFIKSGIDVNTKDLEDKDWYGESALMISSGMGYKDMTLLLIKNKADVNILDDKGRNILWTVIDKNKPEMIKLLVDNKVNLEYRDGKDNGNPLLYAVAENKKDCVKTLIDCGADIKVKRDGSGLLHLAAYKDVDTEIVDLLLNKGLDINEKDKLECTPLKVARLFDKDKIAEYLISKGAIE